MRRFELLRLESLSPVVQAMLADLHLALVGLDWRERAAMAEVFMDPLDSSDYEDPARRRLDRLFWALGGLAANVHHLCGCWPLVAVAEERPCGCEMLLVEVAVALGDMSDRALRGFVRAFLEQHPDEEPTPEMARVYGCLASLAGQVRREQAAAFRAWERDLASDRVDGWWGDGGV